MSIAAVIFKHPAAQGLRVFSSNEAAVNAGEVPASLVSAGGVLIKWPAALGLPPDDATIANWEAERVAAVNDKATRKAAVTTDAEGDAFVDMLRSATPAQIAAQVDTDIPGNSKEKQYIAKLSLAVAYALQGGTDK